MATFPRAGERFEKKIAAQNAAVAAWVADNGYTLCGPNFFIYHVSPHETDNPDEYVTEICLPVRRA